MIARALRFILSIPTNAWFFIVWAIFFIAFQQYKAISQEPFGMHQGAQADRASIAYNFYKKNGNPLEPRVMEIISSDGVCGTEFPLVSYPVSLLYRAFGYHAFWHRFIVFIILSLGAFLAWLFTSIFIQKLLWRVVHMVLWSATPILSFYGVSVLPDAAALGFTLMAWYFFMEYYYKTNRNTQLLTSMIMFAGAGLLKPTFLLGIAVIWGLIILQKLRSKDFQINALKVFLYTLIPLSLSIAWIFYARHLTATTCNTHFLQRIVLPSSLEEFVANTKHGFVVWSESFYGIRGTILLLLGLLIPLAKKGPEQYEMLRFIAIFYACASLFNLVVFNVQYKYHDYYFIQYIPYVFFASAYLIASQIQQRRGLFVGLVASALPIVLIMFALRGFGNTRTLMDRRLTPRDYYYQDVHVGIDLLRDISSDIQAIIPEDASVIIASDPSPNTMLFLIKRYGERWPGWETAMDKKRIAGTANNTKYSYILVNDIKQFEAIARPLIKRSLNLKYQKGIWYLFRLD